MLGESAAMDLAKGWFRAELEDWIRLERTDFGWMARVEEPPIGPGDIIGHPVLAVGPGPRDVRAYPPMPPAQLRQQHTAWIEARDRVPLSADGPSSFT